MQILRPYQTETAAAVYDAMMSDYRRILYTQATGCGKTTTFSEIIRLALENGMDRILVTAHRGELLKQAYDRIKDHCHLTHYQIGIEKAEYRAPRNAKVIVGSIQSLVREGRLDGWEPQIIITDEAHRAAAPSYQKTYAQFPNAYLIGCTATAKRSDRLALYARTPDECPVIVEDKGVKRPVLPAEATFDILCYEYPLLDAIDDGYLVPVVGERVLTNTDLSHIKTRRNMEGEIDFADKELQDAVSDDEERADLIVSAWLDRAKGRPTMVFCAGIEHSELMAAKFRAAGIEAAAVHGKSEDNHRFQSIGAFKDCKLPVLCGADLFVEGFDAPPTSCVLMAKPTKSWTRYMQMAGRGTRTLSGVIDRYETPQERMQAIQQSAKPDCLILDVVDICGKFDVCSAPSMLDLPANLDLQGESVRKAKALIDQLEEVKADILPEITCGTFQELKVTIEKVNLMRRATNGKKGDWAVGMKGFRFMRTPPGFDAEIREMQNGKFALRVRKGQDAILKAGVPADDFPTTLDLAKTYITDAVQQAKAAEPPKSRGTLGRLSPKQTGVLCRNGHTRAEVDCMPYKKAKALIDGYMTAWHASQQQASESAIA
jgi:superfamily II DNA or RNA helicase